ncbi:hypothetical protein M0813_13855 [Anaeramoeba flamelloides]|uniref:Uncharacterized protein n=1 Tax=Anaeramoeba flamelloides TaxID=1746091 RepID=A0ABQ8Z7V4_9EUKA|nr:hypothetical protein M0813_13855 [Anaeramoeba flamelloides]
MFPDFYKKQPQINPRIFTKKETNEERFTQTQQIETLHGVKFSTIIEYLKKKLIQELEEQKKELFSVFVENGVLYYNDMELMVNSCLYLEDMTSNSHQKMLGSLIKITPFEIVIRVLSIGSVRVLISQLAVGDYQISQ